jgi:predicted amidohydrolase YtcJ
MNTSRRTFLRTGAALGLASALGDTHMAQAQGTAATEGATSNGAADADLILINGRIATLNAGRPFVQAMAVRNGRVSATGTVAEVTRGRGAQTCVVDLGGRTVIPGLNDSHTHFIRGGLSFNMELRWDGVPSLADAMRMLKEQAARTPAPQWVRVVGGWSEFQFAEKRMPTLEEINVVSPDVPVFVLHLYDRALLNRAALRAVGYDKNTPQPKGAEIQRDKAGNPTGALIAQPNAQILYSTLAKGPKLPVPDQINSTRHFMRELNRLGVTSAIDAGGGFQAYPEDYAVIEELHKRGQLTVRLAYNLFTQKPKKELADFARWTKMVKPGQGDNFYRMNGAGEMLVFSASDFEDFLLPRPDLAPAMEAVVRLLAQNRWPFRLHATYDESISRFLNVFEKVNRDVPLAGLRWFFDHAETISPRNIERVQVLGGGIAIQHRMAFQGEYFLDRYGKGAAENTPPIRRMLEAGVPVGAGTDATRVASYNPFVALYWLSSGKTLGGTPLYSKASRLSRMEALRAYTVGSTWFSGEEGVKGALVPGHLADFAVLSGDYFSIPEDDIKALHSVLTVVGGKVVYAEGEFAPMAPPTLPVSPDWSPVKTYGGYGAWGLKDQRHAAAPQVHACCSHGTPRSQDLGGLAQNVREAFWGPGGGCSCWAF